MAQQTAVEWLAKQIQDINFTIIDVNDFLECRMHFSTFNEKVEQAKQMEKEQIEAEVDKVHEYYKRRR